MPMRLAVLLCAAGLIVTILAFRVFAPGDMGVEGMAGTGEAVEPPPVAGTWQLAELQGVAQEAGPLLILGVDGEAHGDTGCNGFAGSYEASAGRLAFGPLAMTRRACLNPDTNAREVVYTQALATSEGYMIGDDGLTLRDADGGALAVFAAVPESPPVTFACEDGSDIAAVFLASDPPYARLTRGDGGAMAKRLVSASGARYEGDGVAFRTRGDEAMVNWRGEELACRER